MNFVHTTSPSGTWHLETHTDSLANNIMQLTSFEDWDTFISVQPRLSLRICGENRATDPDLCLHQVASDIVLLIQEDKSAVSRKNPEPQLIAEAIGAFQQNNRSCAALGQLALNEMVIPLIIMVGTWPVAHIPRGPGYSRTV